jgi:serine/threonine protein kinase
LDVPSFNDFVNKCSLTHPNIAFTVDYGKNNQAVDYILKNSALDEVFMRTPIFEANASPD